MHTYIGFWCSYKSLTLPSSDAVEHKHIMKLKPQQPQNTIYLLSPLLMANIMHSSVWGIGYCAVLFLEVEHIVKLVEIYHRG